MVDLAKIGATLLGAGKGALEAVAQQTLKFYKDKVEIRAQSNANFLSTKDEAELLEVAVGAEFRLTRPVAQAAITEVCHEKGITRENIVREKALLDIRDITEQGAFVDPDQYQKLVGKIEAKYDLSAQHAKEICDSVMTQNHIKLADGREDGADDDDDEGAEASGDDDGADGADEEEEEDEDEDEEEDEEEDGEGSSGDGGESDEAGEDEAAEVPFVNLANLEAYLDELDDAAVVAICEYLEIDTSGDADSLKSAILAYGGETDDDEAARAALSEAIDADIDRSDRQWLKVVCNNFDLSSSGTTDALKSRLYYFIFDGEAVSEDQE